MANKMKSFQNHLLELSPFSIRLKHPKASQLTSTIDMVPINRRKRFDDWVDDDDLIFDYDVDMPRKRAISCMRGCLKMSSLHPAQCNSLC